MWTLLVSNQAQMASIAGTAHTLGWVRGTWSGAVRTGFRVGALLGPERTRVSLFLSVQDPRVTSPNHDPQVGGSVGGWQWVTWLGVLFENCTVDASIFVVKL